MSERKHVCSMVYELNIHAPNMYIVKEQLTEKRKKKRQINIYSVLSLFLIALFSFTKYSIIID